MARAAAGRSQAVALLLLVCVVNAAHAAAVARQSVQRFADTARGRHLAQQPSKIDDDLVRKTMPPDPVDWQIYDVEVRNPSDLRRAICHAQGDAYLTDPETNAEVTSCYTVGTDQKRLVVYLREDIFLRGEALPPITGDFKIEGRCENNVKQICAIHAVSAICSACPLPGEDASSNEQEICDACAFGVENGRETTPFVLQPGAKLWLKNIEVAGCKTLGSGGCIKMRSGDRSVWANSAQSLGTDSLTYLNADNCRFKRGYALGEGGQVMVQTGSLAVFQDSSFALNYASASGQNTEAQTADKSHDVMITNFAAAMFIRCSPPKLYVTSTQLLPGVGQNFADDYQQGSFYLSTVSVAPDGSATPAPTDESGTPPDGPPGGGEPPPGGVGDGGGGGGAGGDPDDADESPETDDWPLWKFIVIILVSVFCGGIAVVGCWWCCCVSGDAEDEEESVMKGGKSIFDQVQSTRGMAGKSMMRMRTRMRSGMTNFTSRFQSAFKSTFHRDAGGEGSSRKGSRFAIPGTNKTYSMETLMKGRLRQNQRVEPVGSSTTPVVAWKDGRG